MTAIKQLKTNEEATSTITNVEGEIREFIRKDVVSSRKGPEIGDAGSNALTAQLERVAGTSIREIDNLIAELQVVRDYLRAEGDRVQREVASYAQVSQAAMASAKIITDSMGQWKSAVGSAGR
ncbi:MAG: hypothetical protein QOD74_1718 [Variibacter sp.]|jgi:hypothetical protein|nr:hypothetical protein [Variibacter sp.]